MWSSSSYSYQEKKKKKKSYLLPSIEHAYPVENFWQWSGNFIRHIPCPEPWSMTWVHYTFWSVMWQWGTLLFWWIRNVFSSFYSTCLLCAYLAVYVTHFIPMPVQDCLWHGRNTVTHFEMSDNRGSVSVQFLTCIVAIADVWPTTIHATSWRIMLFLLISERPKIQGDH